MKPLLPGLLFLALLSGCANTNDGISQGRVVLNETLTIPANAATARLQYGRVVPFNGVQEQDPFCIFEIDTVAEGEQTVRPGSFAITRLYRSVESFSGMPVFPAFPHIPTMRVASSLDGDGSPSHIYYKTVFRLAAPDQPVRALTCMSNQMAPGIPIMRHLTLGEIRRALGGIMRLELPI